MGPELKMQKDVELASDSYSVLNIWLEIISKMW